MGLSLNDLTSSKGAQTKEFTAALDKAMEDGQVDEKEMKELQKLLEQMGTKKAGGEEKYEEGGSEDNAQDSGGC